MTSLPSEPGYANASLDNPSTEGASERGTANASLFPLSSSDRGTANATLGQPPFYEWRAQTDSGPVPVRFYAL
jgi:hypothetical protein